MPDFAKLNDFVDDEPRLRKAPQSCGDVVDLIDGVTITPLTVNADGRGHLVELLTSRDGPIDPIVHVYQVVAAPQSVRGWVYHKRQWDRLAYTNGEFRLVLFDLRPDSPTLHKLDILNVGEAFPCLVVVPPFVAHGLKNTGDRDASFVNMPTRAYDLDDPDKSRLPVNHPGMPYRFE